MVTAYHVPDVLEGSLLIFNPFINAARQKKTLKFSESTCLL
jgi:hypothetical protein